MNMKKLLLLLPMMAFAIGLSAQKNVPLDQIRDQNYPDALRNLDVPILLVGVTYDAHTRQHDCRIEVLNEG